jgi:tetratricopeptide (TPR) repeat protein
MEPSKPALPRKYKVMASLMPVLGIMAVFSTVMVVRWRSDYGRLAREKRGWTLALPLLESARENVERAGKDLRLASADPEDITSMADRAVETATQALSRGPDLEEAYRLRGRALELTYNFDEARADYEKCLELHPVTPARFHLGLLLIRQFARARLTELRTSLINPEALRDKAVEHLRRFQAPPPEFKFTPDEKLRFMCSTGVAYAVGDYSKVATHANTAATYDPTEWLMPYLRGLAAFEMKEDEAALKDLDLAVRIAPHMADALAWQGRVLGRLGRRGEAIESLTRALQANRHFLEAYLVRAAFLYEDGRFAEAQNDFRTCAELRPSLPDIHLRRAIASHESWVRSGRTNPGDLQTAEESLTRYLEAVPKDATGLLRRARVRMERRNLDGALGDATAAIAAQPAGAEAYALRAEIHEARGQWKSADQDCTTVIERTADDLETLRRRARVRAKAARPDEAMADYDRLIARDPNDAGLHLEKGGLQFMAGRLDDALATVEKGLAASPRNARLLTLRAEVHLKKGEFDAAIRDASEATEVDPQHADALVVRGRARLGKEDKTGALADFKKALDMRPDLKDELPPLIEKAGP